MRKRLGELAGLPDAELRSLLGMPERAAPRGAPRRPSARRAPSLTGKLLQAILLQPARARELRLPPLTHATAERAALDALVEFCAGSDHPVTTAGLMQAFAGTVHDVVLDAALASAEDDGLSDEQAEVEFRAGVQRLWTQAEREGGVAGPPEVVEALSAEDAERRRQAQLAQKGLA
jgi:hypothetical protein